MTKNSVSRISRVFTRRRPEGGCAGSLINASGNRRGAIPRREYRNDRKLFESGLPTEAARRTLPSFAQASEGNLLRCAAKVGAGETWLSLHERSEFRMSFLRDG